ncbi:MAG: DUF4410 domain-containing protein [Chthoniobacter sp.]|nr:DUF4410 domain-containing protein [Chthoniobacter sp.]
MKSLFAGLIPLSLILLSSCASVSVKGEQRTAGKPVRKPAKIYVADFDTTKGVYKIAGAENKDPEAFKKKIAGLLTGYVVKSVNDHVAPAQQAASTHGLPRSGWLVTGEFVRVCTGSRLLRAGIGLGAGGSKMETRVSIIDLAGNSKPFMTFETTGGSNAMPGLLESSGPGSAVISMTTQSMMGVTDDAARTSRMIAGELNTYLIERGWLSKDKKYSVKKLGDYQLVHEQYFHQ